MRRLAGQAVQHAGRTLHSILAIPVTLAVLAVVGMAVLSWRLAQGPLDLPWAIPRAEQAASALGGGDVAIGGVALVWEGFRAGSAQPVVIRVTDLELRSAAGRSVGRIHEAEVALSVAGLLHGRLQPRAIRVLAPQLRISRAADGAIAIAGTDADPQAPDDPGLAPAIAAALAELAEPPGAGASPLAELASLSIRDAHVAIVDRGLDTVWELPRASLDLGRARAGGVVGRADLDVRLGARLLHAAATIDLPSGGTRLAIAADLPELRPAEIAAAVPRLDMLAAVDLPVRLRLAGQVDTGLKRPSLQVGVTLGAGGIRIARGVLPVAGGQAKLAGTLSDLDLELAFLDLAPPPSPGAAPLPDSPRTRLTGWAHATRAEGRINAALSLSLDRVAVSDLPAMWPEGVGGPGTRPWLTENITDGILSDGHVQLAMTLPEDLSDAEVTYISGGLDGRGLTLHWLRPVPPATGLDGHMTIVTEDEMDIAITGGQQSRMGAGPPVLLKSGTVILTGLATTSQFADIEGNLAGPVAELLTILKHPRLQLLDKRPLPITNPGGQFAGRLTVAHLPLKNDVSVDDLRIDAAVKLSAVRLGGIAAGRDLDGGAFDLTANNDGLKATGTASIASIPAALQIEEDFRPGPPAQVIQKATVSATVTAEDLTRLGVDTRGMFDGSVALRAELAGRRDNRAEAAIRADLGHAGLTVADLNWRKQPDTPGTLEGRILLDRDRVTAIDGIKAAGEGFAVDAAMDFAGGKPRLLRLTRARLGKALDAGGEIGFPATPDQPWQITMQGALLDASVPLTRTTPPGPKTRGPLWRADARFERVILANETSVYGLAVRGESDGWINRSLNAIGRARPNGGAFSLSIAPDGTGRKLTGSSEEAGPLLRALDILPDMRGGVMTLSGHYDDTRPDHRLDGSAEITGFAVRNGAGIGKLLQAMSVYGLIEVVSTPDLAFDRAVAPFRLADDTLELTDARAFNASLGMTAKGRIDLSRGIVDMQGTIVPVYFLNSLLGRLPLIGGLLSPEKGGGLFAANWSMKGAVDDPDVLVNPLAAITPGFLRGMFGMFDSAPTIPVPGDPPPAPRRMPIVPGVNQERGGLRN